MKWTKDELQLLIAYNIFRRAEGWSKYRTIINVRKILTHRSYTSIYDKFMKMFPNVKKGTT